MRGKHRLRGETEFQGGKAVLQRAIQEGRASRGHRSTKVIASNTKGEEGGKKILKMFVIGGGTTAMRNQS